VCLSVLHRVAVILGHISISRTSPLFCVLQCIAAYLSVLQCYRVIEASHERHNYVAVCCSDLQCTLQHICDAIETLL